jgi:hypothetical protein
MANRPQQPQQPQQPAPRQPQAQGRQPGLTAQQQQVAQAAGIDLNNIDWKRWLDLLLVILTGLRQGGPQLVQSVPQQHQDACDCCLDVAGRCLEAARICLEHCESCQTQPQAP